MNALLANFKPDTILSDPMLLVGTILVVLGPLVFLIALVKFFTLRKKTKDDEFLSPFGPASPEPEAETPLFEAPLPPPPPPSPPPPPTPSPVPSRMPSPSAQAMQEKTVVMPAGMAELQGQIEIAITQIRTLNKKVNSLEAALEALSQKTAAAPPAGPSSPAGAGSKPPIMPL